MNRKTGLGIFALVVMASGAWAQAPVVRTIQGDLVNGQVVVLQGSGFGTKGTAAPLKFDDFENGTDRAELSGWVPRVVGGNQLPRYSSADRHAGSRMAATCAYGDGQYLAAFGLPQPTDLTRIYLDFWVRIEAEEPISGNHRLFRLAPGPEAAEPTQQLELSCDARPAAVFSSRGVGDDDWAATRATPGWLSSSARDDWTHVQVFLAQSGPGLPDGVLKCWFDGADHLDRDDYLSRGATNAADWQTIWFGEYYSLTGTPDCPAAGRAQVHFDDIYVDTTEARVEIGNAAVYANCTHREIQIPTAWSDREVSIRANLGSFEDGAQVWVFLIAESGVIADNFGPFTVGPAMGPGQPGQPTWN